MSKKSGFVNAVYVAQAEKLRKAGLIARMQTLDKVTITLGQLGMTPEFITKFGEEFQKVEEAFCKEVLDDSAVDDQLVYAKACIDRALKQYTEPDKFIPYEKRYNF